MSPLVQTVFEHLIDWLFKPTDTLCSQLLTGAFNGLVGSMSNSQWNIAIVAANRIGWVMGFVNMALCVLGALHAAAKGSVADVVKSFAMAVLAWPLTAVCVSVMITLDGIVGVLTNRILTVPLDGSAAGLDKPFGDSVVSNVVGTVTTGLPSLDLEIRIIAYVLVLVASIALAGMLAARDICLILLAAVAPLPVMMSGWRVTRPAAGKWVQAVVGVLLSAPLSALVIMVGSGMCYIANHNPSMSGSFFPALMGLATLFMACFSPKLIMPVVSFVGNNVAADMQERGGKVGPNAIKAAIQVTAGVVSAAATGGATAGLAGLGGARTVSGAASAAQAATRGDWGGLGERLGSLLTGGKDGQATPDHGKTGDTPAGTASTAGRDTGAPGTGSGDVPRPAPATDTRRQATDGVMDTAARPAAHDGNGEGDDNSRPATPPAPQPAAPPMPGAGKERATTVPGAPGGRGGDAHAAPPAPAAPGAPGGQGGDGADATATASGGTGGQGGDGAPGGASTAGRVPGVPGSPSGPTVG